MNLETVIQEKVHALPISKQAKVLEFVEDLEIETNGQKVENKPIKNKEERRKAQLALIGMFSSGHSDTSVRAEEILAEEINKRSGWTIKEPIAD